MAPTIASAQTGPSSNGVVGDLSWKQFLAGGSEGVKEAVILEGGHSVKLVWADGHESEFSLMWLRDHSDGSFHASTMQRKLRGVLKSHGIALVRGVPTDSAATEALALKLTGCLMGGILGNVWAISTDPVDSGPSVNDSAYTTHGLPLHTDHSYVTETPGLLVFSCLLPAPEGGESTYVDGFAVAERLRKENPEAFDFFTKTSIKHQYLDHEYHLVSEGPIIRTDSFGVVNQLRYHEHYRAPMDYLSTDDLDRFYEHHKALIAITRDPSMVEHIRLEQGDTMILNNHRAMHGRESYKGSRRMLGCYVSKDEANSEARMKGI